MNHIDYTELDKGVAPYVKILRDDGVMTFESCEGGRGHCTDLPMIRFHGVKSEGWRALSIALDHHLPVVEICREWSIVDGEPEGAYWRMTFNKKASKHHLERFTEVAERLTTSAV